ncbi:MAG: hypothetical protein AAGG72_04820, partial [Pseudomonadota bacterium]
FPVGTTITATDLLVNWTANGNMLSLVSVSPTLPAGLSVSSLGQLSGTPSSITADATYTLTMADKYARQTAETFTLETTEAPPIDNEAPVINSAAWVAADQTLNLLITEIGPDPDTVDLYVVSYSGAVPSDAQTKAGSGGSILEAFDLQNTNGGSGIDLGFTLASDGLNNLKILVEDDAGNTAETTLTNILLDATPPTVSTAATNAAGDAITITFTEALTGANSAADFAISGHTIGAVTGSGNTRTLTGISPTIANGDVDTLAYTPGDLSDEQGNALASFTGQAIVNNVPASGGIALRGALVDAAANAQNDLSSISLASLGLQQGDVVYVEFHSAAPTGQTTTFDTPGWTPIITGTLVNAAGGQDCFYGLYRKVMTSTPDTSVDLTWNIFGSQRAGFVNVRAYSGVDTSTPEDGVAVVPTSDNAGLNPNPGAITPATPGAWIAMWGGNADTDENNANCILADPAYLDDIEKTNVAGTITGGATLSGDFRAWSSGAYDPPPWAAAGAVANGSAYAITLALRPA